MIKQNYFHLPGYIIQDSPPSLSQSSNSTEKMVAGANIDCFWNKFSIDKNNKGNYLASLMKTQSKDQLMT